MEPRTQPSTQGFCAFCGAPVEGGSRRRFCSNACRQKAHRARHESKRQRVCLFCGNELPRVPGRPGRPRSYCDDYCRQAAGLERLRRGSSQAGGEDRPQPQPPVPERGRGEGAAGNGPAGAEAAASGNAEPAPEQPAPVVGRGAKVPARARVALALMVVVAALLVVELPVSAFVERDRQRRLAARFVVPTRTVAAGDALAVLQVEKIGLNEVVVRGDGSNLLRSGPGLRPGTPAPGAPGNSVIVGRRLRYGAPMARLRELARGDEIVVWVRSTPHPVAFRVTRTRHVDGSSRPPAAAGDARLTLVTAAPGLPTSDLLLVEAELVGAAPKATSSVGASGRDGRPGTWVSPARRSGYAAGAAAWITVLLCLPVGFRWLHRRLRRAAARAVVAPVAAVAIVGLALALEGIIPRLV